MSAETATIHYSRITERRAKAVQLDIGEKKPVWFPLHRITLDEANYTVTVPQALLTEKRAAAQGAPIKRDPRDFERVKLPEPAWENDRSIRIDVIVSGLSGRGKVRKSLFFPKSQIEDGTAPRWLVEKKQKDVMQEVAASRRCPESQLIVRPFTETGLLAEASAAPEAPEAEPQELRRIAQQAFQP
jgi:hypothetical protein